MFRRIVFAAAVSGLIAGLFLSAAQALRVIPLILEAETYEKASPPARALPAGTPALGDEAGIDFSRTALTAVSNVISAIGFALLLVAGFSLRGGSDWRSGILWGLGGFAAFSLAPSLGLPPELPGTFAAPLAGRQVWWAFTAAATSGGLAFAAFSRGWGLKAFGAALIALPHLIGAPQPAQHGGLAPEALMQAFVLAALATSLLYWIVLGTLAGYFFHRFEQV